MPPPLYLGFDWDGTLDLPGLPPKPELAKQFAALTQQGAKLFLASGKAYEGLLHCSRDLLSPYLFCCENAGHVVIPSQNHNAVYPNNHDLALFATLVDESKLPPKEPAPEKRATWFRLYGKHVLQAEASLKALIAEYDLALEVYAYPDIDGAIDVVPQGMNKVNVLRFLPEEADIYFFGDGDNDYHLMHHDRVKAYTVSNAKPIIKDCVTGKGGVVADQPASHGVSSLLTHLFGV